MQDEQRRNAETMIKKISDFIVSKRNAILAVMLILAVASVFCTQFVEINVDMTKYLPDDSNMKAGIDIMAEEFPEIETFNSIRVMFDGLTEEQKVSIWEELGAFYGVGCDQDEKYIGRIPDQTHHFVISVECVMKNTANAKAGKNYYPSSAIAQVDMKRGSDGLFHMYLNGVLVNTDEMDFNPAPVSGWDHDDVVFYTFSGNEAIVTYHD